MCVEGMDVHMRFRRVRKGKLNGIDVMEVDGEVCSPEILIEGSQV